MKLFLRKFKTASKFYFSEWKIIFLGFFLLFKTRLLLFFLPSQTVAKTFFLKNPTVVRSRSFLSKKEILDLFQIAWRYQPGKPKCLARSLAEYKFLSHYGFPVQLRIGIKKEGEFQAHAWCEPLTLPSPPVGKRVNGEGGTRHELVERNSNSFEAIEKL